MNRTPADHLSLPPTPAAPEGWIPRVRRYMWTDEAPACDEGPAEAAPEPRIDPLSKRPHGRGSLPL